MKSITLKNTLSENEKKQLFRLFGHDGAKPFSQINNAVYLSIEEKNVEILEEEGALGKIHFMAKVIETIKDFNLYETIELFPTISDTHYRRDSLKISMEKLKSLFDMNFSYDISENIPGNFLTKTGSLQCVLFNLIKNGFEHTTDDTSIFLDINYIDSFPLEVVYVPEGSKNHNEFIGFHVSNTGAGFLSEKKLEDYITIQPGKGKRGFGLYFTGLVARVLQAPINIESKDDITTISFFQPIYKQK